MGFSISWIAISGHSKASVLSSLSLVDTGEPDEANESPISGGELPGGWYLMFFNDIVHPFTRKPQLTKISAGGSVLVCQVEEHVMASAAFMYVNGVKTWDVTHESEKGLYNISTEGCPPIALQAIQAELKAAQDADGGDEADVDHIFDVPVALAAALCGYRHDRVALVSGEEPQFTKLVGAGA